MQTSNNSNPPSGPLRPADESAAGSTRGEWAVPCGIMVIAATLRLAGIEKSLWMDEAGSLAQAGAGDFIAMARDYDHPPLYFALLRAGLNVTSSFTLLRLFSVACGLGAIVLFCRFFRSRDLRAGWIAALLLATLPGFAGQAQELRQYALLSLWLSAALLCAWRLLGSPRDTRMLVGLAVTLTGAVSTHLLAAFFMIAVAAVVGFSLRQERMAVVLRAAAAFVPAALLAWYFKAVFLLRAAKSPEHWWMPPVRPGFLGEVFGEITGWNALRWLADACGRHAGGSGTLVLGAAALAVAFVCWVAWARRPAGAAHLLLAMALIYWGLLVGYSLLVLPIVWPRTLLPGMLPFVLGLGLGVSTHPATRSRVIATATIVALCGAMALIWLRGFAFRPVEDLRGLARSLQSATRANPLLILVNGVELGLEPYWPGYKSHALVKLDMGDPALSASLQAARSQQPAGREILLLYRDDLYLAPQRPTLDAVVTSLSASGSPGELLWNKDGYHLMRFGPGQMSP